MSRPVVHFEIGCQDIPGTAEFYQKTFGWEITPAGNAAPIQTGPAGALPGHLNKLGPDDPQQYVTVYIQTDDLDKDLRRIESNGGEIFVGPIDLPDSRRFAWFKDVAGNLIGLITPLSGQ